MKNIILTLLSIPKVGKKSVGYFIKYMQEIPKNENDIIDIFIDIKNDNKRIKVPTLEEVKLAYERAEKIVSLSKKQNIFLMVGIVVFVFISSISFTDKPSII